MNKINGSVNMKVSAENLAITHTIFRSVQAKPTILLTKITNILFIRQ